MRLIGQFQSEKQAFEFQLFLQNHGIKSIYDSILSQGRTGYRVWIIEEDDFDSSVKYYQQWQQEPKPELLSTSPSQTQASLPHLKWKINAQMPHLRSPFSMNNFIILLCSFFFLWTGFQTQQFIDQYGKFALNYMVIPLEQHLLYDYPLDKIEYGQFFETYSVKTSEELQQLPLEAKQSFKSIGKTPQWTGLAGMIQAHDWKLLEKLPEATLFGKIRQGEVWRLFTPVLLHGGFLHILFNMLWLFLLGRQIEERVGKWRYLLLSLFIGVMSNTAQYLMSGPFFLGYSGIITGMVGFIWMRQKIAPWEGYPLQRPVIVFITVFVIAMLALEIVSMILQFLHQDASYANIANTAHVVGGFFGALCGRLSLFARGHA